MRFFHPIFIFAMFILFWVTVCIRTFVNKINTSIYFPQTSNLQMNGSDKTIYIDSDNDDEQSNKTTTSRPPIEDVNVACSSKATSVIRMASQAASQDTKPTLRASIANVKIPYNRPPKKLVVKLKKPFVPVIEEEANLHPPENRSNATTVPFNANVNVESASSRQDTKDMGVSNNQNSMLECSEDVPYSPIRQSYTPQLPFDQYQDVDEQNEAASNEISETKYVPICSYKLESNATSTNRMNFNDTAELECNPPCLEHKNEVIVFEISIEDSKDLQNVENDTLWEVDKENKLQIENKDGNDLLKPSSSSCSAASTSSSFTSEPLSNKSAQNHLLNADSSNGVSYRLPTFHRNDEDYVCTPNHQSAHLEGDASTSNPHFSSKYKYTSLESDKKTSYMNTDRCKNTSNTERAPSADSLNIITDEKMPAKGEISEQESNGDIENSWSHQVSCISHCVVVSTNCIRFGKCKINVHFASPPP